MTPNPNPSPRDLLAQAYQDNGDLGAAGYIRSGHDLTPDTQIALLAIKDALALSPQTLPAPGEVEALPVGYTNPALLARAKSNPLDTGCASVELYRYPAGDYCLPLFAAAPDHPALATVAAANDEGVASDTVAFVQDWLMNADYDPTQFDKDFAAAIDARVNAAYEAAAKVADDYEPFTGDPAYDAATDVAAVTIGAAIRLLSQGVGKA